MAESVITPIAEKIAGYLVAPIGRRLSYLFCYRSYTDKLHDKVQKLGKARDDTKLTVNEARQRGDEIRPVVQEWLNRVDEITAEAEALMKDENKSCFNGWCPNLKSRYLISREADKKAQIIVEIQNDNNFPHGVSCRVLPRNVTFKEYESFESRATTLNKIMDALRDDKMKMIGVWGMGGVGKTTLVKQVAEQAKQDELFKTEVYIDVSWTREPAKIQQGISDIQQKIADMLGLEFKNEAQSTKAAKLMQRLQEGKILIVLDDIWKEIDLEKVGIPCKDDQKDCKIVLASRDEDLLRRDMGAQECFPIQHLQEEEAWHLFKRTAGDSVEGDELRPIAIEVVNKCEGLPIAIVTIANALKDRSVDVWENALDELRSSEPANIRGVDDKVYGCLKWSYNHLNGDEVKSLFLLCGSLSYGDISMDHLLSYAMGLDSFDHIKSLKLARNKLVTLVGTLKASSLLLDSEDHRDHFRVEASTLLFMDADNKSVRMHDLVRDVARNIASKDPHLFVVKEDVPLEEWSETDESKYISLNCTDVHELPHRLVCPKLQFFLLQSNSPSLNIPDTFFEGMNLLKVLGLSKMHFTTLPSTLHSLANLRTLRLDRCELGDIALIGELKKLQVLSMVGSNIQQLPNEMVKLTNLRLLDLNDCEKLEVIPRNILSSLSRLECLCMKSSFTQWAAEGVSDGESNACLSELNHLRHLTTIEIEVPAVKLLPKEDTFFQNLTRYAIFIGNLSSWEKNYKTSKTLKLKGPVDGSLLLRDGIDKLLKKTEELELGELEEVCRGPIPRRSFDNLKTLDVEKYHGLKFFFFLSSARGLSHLEKMKIKDCNAMQQIIAYERESEIKEDDHAGTNLQLFTKLRSLKLRDLPELINFSCFDSELETTSQGMCSQGNLGIHMPFFSYQVSFPNLEQLELCDLPKLKEIWHHQLPFESFNNLQILKVSNCPCLLNLIPSHLIQRFNNLKYIDVSHCEVIEHVFDLQGLDINVGILPKLTTLKLEGLHKLRYIICNEEKNDSMRYLFSALTLMDFQSLEFLSIKYHANEDNEEGHVNTSIEDVVLFGGKVSFSNLKELKLNGFPKLKMIWHRQFPSGSFNNLQILEVYHFPCLLNLIPSHLIQRLENLKKIKVFHCEVLEHVFDHQGLDRNIGILPKLETLELEELPRLRYIICKEDKNDNMRCLFSPPTLTDFQNLKYLSIKNCANADKEEGHVNTSIEDAVLFGGKVSFSNLKELKLNGFPKLKMIWHCQFPSGSFNNLQILEVYHFPCLLNLIPSHLIQRLENLKKIKVFHCEVLEHVFDHQGLDRNIGILPKLETLELEELPRLRYIICKEDKNDNMRCLFSPPTLTDFQNLKYLSLKNCANADKEEGHVNTSIEDAVLFGGKASFSNLKKLELKGFPKLKEIWHHQLQLQLSLEFFYNLQILIVDDCPSLVNLVPSYLIQSFRNLEKINVQHCGVLEYVFDLKRLNGDVEILPKLKILNLNTLPRLRHIICNEDKRCLFFPSTSKDFQSLREVRVVNCRMQDKVNVNTSTKDVVLLNEKPSFLDGVSNDEAFDSCLEWSYTHLKGDDVKSLFLLCGMLGYGDISLDHLLQYGMGLDLFDRIDSLEQARNRLLALLEILKASSLLLDGHEDRLYFGEARPSSLLFMDADNKFVRMRDVVYDVARAIASKDPHPFVVREDVGLEEWSETDESKRCTFISLNCKAVPELPHGLVCPELQFFLLHNNNPSLNIPDTFFQGMKNLKVLDLSKMRFTTLPSSFDSLANLRTLRLDGCGLVDIALIGKLTKLEVLSLAGSTIQQLPNEMVQLTNLRLLDLNDCCKLEVIPRNILSSLSRLECLHMNSSFPKWAVEGESNACLSELNHLSHLTTLDIEIIDVKLLPKDILFENLTRYAIFMGDWLWVRDCKTKRALKLKGVNISLHLGDGINKLLERSEELEFKQLSGTKYVLHPSDRESFLELKHLRVSRSPEIQYIIDSTDLWFPQHGTFPLHNLEEVWHDPIPAGPFGNLKTLHVSFCHGLKFLFLPSTARGLSQLEEMEIQHCDAMQSIIAYERESEIKEDEHVGTNLQLFPKLRSLKLNSLPQLINFYSELETTSSTSLSTNARLEGSFFNHQVSFPKLEELKLDYLPKLKNIWHHQLPIESHFIQSFQNLKKIHVQNCQLLEHVIILQGIDENVEILPKLETLKLKALPKLRWIEDGNGSMKYISSPLTLMNIQNLKELRITKYRLGNWWKM